MNIQFSISPQAVAFITAFGMTLLLGPIFIPILRRLKFGQTVRDDGPSTHLKKTGTPTMGGIFFLLPLIVLAIYYSVEYPKILPLVLATIGFGAVGFVDDFIKVVRKRKDGLYPRQKTFGLILVATVYTFYMVYGTDLGTDIIIPFKGMDATFALPEWIYIPFTIIFLYAVTNSVNLTDGVDGLCAGVTLIILVFFTIVALSQGEWDYIKLFSALVAGGSLGFLAYNTYPARVFMGDTGSLALGGAVGVIAIAAKMPWILLIIGGVYVLESLSVIIQVAYFKRTRKRVFKMTPIHHHFELSGWRETKVVSVFYVVTVVLCLVGFVTLRFRFY